MNIFKRIAVGVLAAVIAAFSCSAAVFAVDDWDYEEAIPVPELYLAEGGNFQMNSDTAVFMPVRFNAKSSGSFSKIVAQMSGGNDDVKVNADKKTVYDFNDRIGFEFSASKTALSGTYDFTLTANLYNNLGEAAGSQTFPIRVTVVNKLKVTGMTIESCTVDKENIAPGDIFKVTVTLRNNCGIDVKNAELELGDIGMGKFAINNGFSVKYVDIKNGKTGSATFELIAQDGIQSDREYITINLSYSLAENRSELSRKTSASIVVNCSPKKDESDTKYTAHAITMTKYSVSKQPVAEGTKFALTVNVKNTDTVEIKNARITVEADGTKFAIDSGLNHSDFDIKPGASKSFVFNLIGCSGIAGERENIPVKLDFGSSSVTETVVVTCDPPEKKSDETLGKFDLTMTGFNVSSSAVSENTHFKVSVTLLNSSKKYIKQARITVDADGTKFAIDKGLNHTDFDMKAGESRTFTFDLIGCSGIASERETIPVTLDFGSNSVTETVVVACDPPEKKSDETLGKFDLNMTGFTVSVPEVRENTPFTVTLTLLNSGKKDIEKARVSLLNLDGTKFAADSSLTSADISMKAGESKVLSFDLIGCKGIASVREAIPVQIDYGSVSNTAFVTVKCVPKDSSGTDEDGKKIFAPNIIINNYTFGGEFVTAGQKFPLTLEIENMSADAVVENLKVTISGGATGTDGSVAYSPANSSNSFFFDKLDSHQRESFSIELLAKADANPNSYPINISFSYEYSVGKERFQANPIDSTLSVPLRQEDRLVINDPEIPSWGVYTGQMCQINTSLVNKGKSDVYNVTATVEGDDFSVETVSYYIGNIKSGSEEYYDAKITPFISGDVSGALVFTYEDANGEEKETRIPFTLMVEDMNYDGMYDDYMDTGMEDVPEEEPNYTWVWFVAGGGALAIVIFIIILVSVRNKKKKEAELADDDENI